METIWMVLFVIFVFGIILNSILGVIVAKLN